MRKLVTGFIAGTLVTIVAMLAIFGDDEDSATLSGTHDDGPAAADFPIADAPDAERRRRATPAAAAASATDSGGPGGRAVRPATDAAESDQAGSVECCTVAVTVASDADEFTNVEETVGVPLLEYPESPLAPTRPYLTGKWEGVMTGIGPGPDGSLSEVPPFDAARGQYGFRLDIRQTNLVMYFQNGDQWISLGEGQDLRTNEQGRSAVAITALNAANGGIEAVMLNIVRWSEDSIAVHISRVSGAGPNGGPLPPSVDSMGILERAVF